MTQVAIYGRVLPETRDLAQAFATSHPELSYVRAYHGDNKAVEILELKRRLGKKCRIYLDYAENEAVLQVWTRKRNVESARIRTGRKLVRTLRRLGAIL